MNALKTANKKKIVRSCAQFITRSPSHHCTNKCTTVHLGARCMPSGCTISPFTPPIGGEGGMVHGAVVRLDSQKAGRTKSTPWQNQARKKLRVG